MHTKHTVHVLEGTSDFILKIHINIEIKHFLKL